MPVKLIYQSPSADSYPLLIKNILKTPLIYHPNREIVYRDKMTYTYFDLDQRVQRLANALAALLAARHAGVPPHLGVEALCGFRNVKRRMELRSEEAEFEVRVGINSGDVVARDTGAPGDARIYGDTLNVAARAHAFMRHRGYVTPEDIKAIGPDVLRHRIIRSYEAEAEEITSEDIVTKIFETVAVP